MNKKELIKEIERLYKIEEDYYRLLQDLGKIRVDKKEKQKSFSEIYDKIVTGYIIKQIK